MINLTPITDADLTQGGRAFFEAEGFEVGTTIYDLGDGQAASYPHVKLAPSVIALIHEDEGEFIIQADGVEVGQFNATLDNALDILRTFCEKEVAVW